MLTQQRLKELIFFDSETGLFTWKVNVNNRIKVGKVISGSTNASGYKRIRVDGRLYYAHRLAWLYVHGYWPKEIDHINRNRADNRLENLRECTRIENVRNTGGRKIRRDNKSGYKGVSWDARSNKWIVAPFARGRQVYIASYRDINEATKILSHFEEMLC